jgi:hypothetical protein
MYLVVRRTVGQLQSSGSRGDGCDDGIECVIGGEAQRLMGVEAEPGCRVGELVDQLAELAEVGLAFVAAVRQTPGMKLSGRVDLDNHSGPTSVDGLAVAGEEGEEVSCPHGRVGDPVGGHAKRPPLDALGSDYVGDSVGERAAPVPTGKIIRYRHMPGVVGRDELDKSTGPTKGAVDTCFVRAGDCIENRLVVSS